MTLSEAPGNNHFVLAGGDPTYGEFDRADENGHYKVIQRIAADATSASIELTKTYNKVYILNTEASNEILKIASITRTITTASSVAAPTITPASGTYDGDLTVTITKGAGNEKVVYSVSGATTGNVTDAEFTADSKPLTLTGTGTITVTAKGVKGSDESSEVTNTYTYSIPSGINTVWESSKEVSNSWASEETFTIPTSKFSELEIGDYIFIYASPASNVEYIGFRNGWSEDGFSTNYTAALGATSGGDLGKGTMQSTDTYWWAKIINSSMQDIFKTGDDPRVQGKSYESGNDNKFTITKVEIRKHVDIGEGANTISKSTDMIVNLGRSFTANTWNTVCLPFVPTSAQADELFGSGYQLAAFTGVSGTTMKFTTIAIDAFEAGKPYLVLPKTGCATGTTVLFDVDITAKNPTPVTFGNYTFTGTFTTKEFTSADNTTSRFVATGNELMTPENGTTLKSLRCYFTVPATPVTPARSLTFDVDEEGNTTGVADINRETITNNGDFFNLAGQRVAQPTKGLYIVNGKKVVIK